MNKLFLVALILTGCSAGQPLTEIPFPPLKLNKDPKKFSTCGDLREWQAGKLEKIKQYDSRNAGVMATAVSSQTNNQEIGIDEGDTVKFNNRVIYFARSNSVEVISRPSLKHVRTLAFGNRMNLQLFLVKNRLIVIGEDVESKEFIASIHAASTDMRLIAEYKLPGRNVRARLIASEIIMVSQLYSDFERPLEKDLKIPCDRIQRPAIDDLSGTITTLHRLSLESETPTLESQAIVGSADQIYVTPGHIYLANYSYRWFPPESQNSSEAVSTDTIILRFDSHSFQFEGVDSIRGTTNNQFSFHESGDHLFVATTLGFTGSFDGNQLWTLGTRDQKFQVLARSAVFAPHEDIRSARFIGSRAYVVTFEKTDPLYTIDISNPLAPVIVSELKMPGFSAYLHPIAANLLFGAGYGAHSDKGFSWFQGAQLSIFRLFSDGRVDVVDQKEFGGRGSHVDVVTDHHALNFDAEKKFAYLPVRLMSKVSGMPPWEYSTTLEFSGLFVINSVKGVEPVARLSHRDLIPQSCHLEAEPAVFWSARSQTMDITRSLVLPEGLVTLSEFGARLYDPVADFVLRRTSVFSSAAAGCPKPDQGRPPRI